MLQVGYNVGDVLSQLVVTRLHFSEANVGLHSSAAVERLYNVWLWGSGLSSELFPRTSPVKVDQLIKRWAVITVMNPTSL